MVVVVGYQSAIDNLTPGVLTENNGVWTGSQVPTHDVVVGAAGSTLTGVAPSSTSGVALISQGASSNPAFGTTVVAGGGTGVTSATAYSVICGGTTSTGAFQPLASVGSSNQVLTSNGAGALPSFQSVSASGAIITITGNSGGAEAPLAGNFTIVGTGSITAVGSASTETIQLTGLTNHAVLVGAGTATMTNVAPSVTSGVPLISQGSSSDPAFGTAVVAGGGSGVTSFTTYAPICGGTTTTGSLQSATTGLATSGFVLTSNGNAALPSFQTVAASGAITTITGNSGGAEVPSAGNFNILGTGSITSVGTSNTETVQLTGLTNHNVLVGAGTDTITKVAPSSTSGVPFISNGASSDPSFGTAVVAGGGTGITTTTAYAPICGGTTSTGSLQAATTGLSTSGFVLQSNGSSTLPSFVTPSGLSLSRFSQVKQTVLISNTTYTPTAGMAYVGVLAIGGGGGGGGCASTAGGQFATASGGGAGGYSIKLFTAGAIGASQTVTIGASGAGGAAGNNSGSSGGNTTLGALMAGNGGSGGVGGSAQSTVYIQAGGAGGSSSGGDYFVAGSPGGMGITLAAAGSFIGGSGGNSIIGGGAANAVGSAGINAVANTGSGGGGASSGPSSAAVGGGNGAAGTMILLEYIAT